MSYSKLPTPANLSGLQKHPHGKHWKTPNPTPHLCTLPETVIGAPACSARGFPSLSLSISMFCCPLLISQETSQTSQTGDCRAHLEILGSLLCMTSLARAERPWWEQSGRGSKEVTGYQWRPGLTLPEYLFWGEKKPNQTNNKTAVRQLLYKRSSTQMLLQLDPSTKGGIISFFLNSQELRTWWWEEVREIIAALQPLQCSQWSLWAHNLEIPNGPSMFFPPAAAAAAKVHDCDHLNQQRAVLLPPPSHKPCPWGAPCCQCSSLSNVVAFKNPPFQASLEWFHGAFADSLINDLSVLQNKNLLGAETETQH